MILLVQCIERGQVKTTFIGHRDFLPSDIEQRLQSAIQSVIDLGCRNFMVGSHGEFDKKALSVCRGMQAIYPDLQIEVVITNFGQTYQGVETIMYEIENLYYKQRITKSNQFMINDCDNLICYVRPNSWHSGAKIALDYAIKKGLKITNLAVVEQ